MTHYRCCRPRGLPAATKGEVRPALSGTLRLRRSCAWPVMLLLVLLSAADSYAQSKLAGKYTKAGGNFLTVSSTKESEVQISIFGSYRENTCIIETDSLKPADGVVTYQPSDDKDCTVRVTFRKDSANVEQNGNCGCGLNVNLSGEYRKRSGSKGTKNVPNAN